MSFILVKLVRAEFIILDELVPEDKGESILSIYCSVHQITMCL